MLLGTRSYNRLVLRLRAWAERESNHSMASPTPNSAGNSIYGSPRSPPNASRSSSRAPSPNSSFTHGYGPRSTHGHGTQGYGGITPPVQQGFRSPLFRTNRAPLLRVFVPSPEGDWLSDASVLECEEELKRAGLVGGLMRMGDVVWDMAVGEEGNAGRMIWDGSYLIDLDYTYSPIGDLPRYIPGFAFPPSYFHRIIRTAASSTSSANPILRLDISPWGAEIASSLQLLQDRVRTETPQGSFHNVVRWVHRSSFHLRSPQPSRSHGRTSVRVGNAGDNGLLDHRIPLPSTSPTGAPLFVDPGWYGKVVVETEGTNEALGDLQDRCGSGAFPPRATPNTTSGSNKDKDKEDGKLVWRILRERSRPGEIWLRTVSTKERLM
ncbi:hypothetical protein BDP27DRAFT_1221271 [Rhodocollybia butyracea]|uniref:Uncharacterized protein n=1 Tax=Rhodocollybia butyracea TaxID=206335 RepID=A0A9P5PW00_9AGAR|nr:hypothetical protein BDP27DRAFT_1221271 [Rhodocollybia butyracea]